MHADVGRWTRTIAVALAIAAGTPASAGAATFGADLNQSVNIPQITCGAGVPNQFLLEFIPGTGAASCLWSSVAIGSSQALEPPTGGTVTTVRVRTGAATGLMQVDVVRFLTHNTLTPGHPELACCFVERYGPVFTPQANAVTAVQTSLPMQEDPFPPPEDITTIAANDVLALAVLEPNVPVPVFATNGGKADLNVLSYAWYPAPTSPGVPAPSPNPVGGFADLSGFQVLMSADLETGGGGGGGAPAGGGGAPTGGGPPPVPVIGLPKLTIPVKGNTATIPLVCQVIDCTGTLTLQNARLAGLARAAKAKRKTKKPRVVSYGSARFSIKAGTTGKVKITLNAGGRKLLKGHRSTKVWANVRFSSGGGAPKSTQVKLTR